MKSNLIVIFASALIILLSRVAANVIPIESRALEDINRDGVQLPSNLIGSKRRKRCIQHKGCRMPGHPNSPFPLRRSLHK